ncbi:GNAT family N-acetyltransferase [Photobacterium lutimaris]|uniref:GNAT family N-acetyltransferase n=1 Tax=Photobacterium lutimaris TaxID=388278 RepID=A0A2T3IS92_9GAMM|nr:GNAT family N-acetyltransferase [Photobacterium lutimaris]PSU31223.1 GNAT family N-acetyltransferase [Photobacterium lutimaris]TDR69913.1 acetyltransferase (GNAT) family protein [Photobacterium lutimaris]
MIKLRFHLLEPLRFPLINRFYKSYYPAGKAKKDEVIWIGEDSKGIQACVRFKQFDEYQLLTGMLVHPDHRSQGHGIALLEACNDQLTTTQCYCFAFSHLETFYQGSGFVIIKDNELPEPLQSRINRYRQSGKTLTPMIYAQRSKLELS